MTDTLDTAAAKFAWGSAGFAQFIRDSGEFGATVGEIKAIAAATKTPAEFQALWEQGGAWEGAE